ncbi:ABC transporter permease [Phyllobacterium endophyticum]|uniref:ABC transporter permease n=1 Tax=Phyllobacterium endophyticum TaxID=1149773 RepID=A0A2P7B1S5_9HYPH|nr:ABC transporter permease [Phyllobacterium endophyticum]MBB3238006.1 peptide/nickel transport system permease protein [Phyllobacterium endophyticum]PSH60425.1 ABC transporter permease [Phyllobacterium endophyticum]TYR42602.1 ABC transporter permease [Phyllobacterium endophyticum]
MPPLLAFFLRRIVTALPVLAVVLVGSFLLLEAAPGDAVDAYVARSGAMDADQLAQLRQEWQLDEGPLHRFRAYASALVQGDLGWSSAFERRVASVILERLPITLLLMGVATALAFFLGSLLGVIAGANPGSFRDRFLSTTSLALYAVPGFWLGLVLIVIFAVDLRWLPIGGIESIASGKTGFSRMGDIGRHLILPVASLAMVYLALYLRLMRDRMNEVWRDPFVQALKARGLSRNRIVWRHVARNAVLPVVTMLGLQAAAMLGGSVVVESVFAIPGFGRLAAEAVARRDTPLLLGVILCSAITVITVNLLVDLAYGKLDPRVRVGR